MGKLSSHFLYLASPDKMIVILRKSSNQGFLYQTSYPAEISRQEIVSASYDIQTDTVMPMSSNSSLTLYRLQAPRALISALEGNFNINSYIQSLDATKQWLLYQYLLE